MFTRSIFTLSFLFYFIIKSTDATVSCTHCPAAISLNLTTDTNIDTKACNLQDSNICTLQLHIDYIDSNMTFALFDGTSSPVLVLTNGELQITRSTSIWFTEVRVQRIAQILCFVGASCGLDQIKKIYTDEYRSFDYTTIQNTLANRLYTSAELNSTLTCADVNGTSVPCPNGFCQSIADGNGILSYSTCLKTQDITPTYGLIVQKVKAAGLNTEASTITYICNKPMCNSQENSYEVIKELAAAGIIPQPIPTTTQIPITTTNQAVFLQNNRNLLLISSLLFLSFCAFFFIE